MTIHGLEGLNDSSIAGVIVDLILKGNVNEANEYQVEDLGGSYYKVNNQEFIIVTPWKEEELIKDGMDELFDEWLSENHITREAEHYIDRDRWDEDQDGLTLEELQDATYVACINSYRVYEVSTEDFD